MIDSSSAPQGPTGGPVERPAGVLDLSPWGVNLTLTLDRDASGGQTDGPGRRRRGRQTRASRVIEPTDYAAMMRRMIAAHGRRVADADLEDLAELIALRADLEDAIAYAVRESRSRWQWSWSEIGRAVGLSKQAAQQKWGHR